MQYIDYNNGSMSKHDKKPQSTFQKIIQNICTFCISILSSKWTIWIIILLFILNALWVALLYRFPLVFDENFHFHVIDIFSHTFSPIIINQSPNYDLYGNLTYGNASLYHYILSFPLRFVAAITDSFEIQVLSLRIINVLLAASGVYVFYKLFNELGIKKHLINIGLFIFAFMPLVTNVAATISYDNLLFLLTALFFLYSARLIKLAKPDTLLILQILFTGTFASLTKFTFLPLFAFAAVYLFIYIIKKSGGYKKAWSLFTKNFKTSKKRFVIIAWLIPMLIVLGLAAFRYGTAMIIYKTPIPDCTQTMSEERCNKNPVSDVNKTVIEANKNNSLADPSIYIINWTKTMISGFSLTLANTPKTEGGHLPSVYQTTLTATLASGILFLIYAWRSLKLDNRYTFIVLSCLSLLFATLVFNAMTYYQFHANLNVQPRYAVSILPILLVFSVMAVDYTFRKYRLIKLALLCTVLLATTQGGGLVSHALVSNDAWYRDNINVLNFERNVRNKIDPLVKEWR